jgi:NitT/TauT family transport system substrate-binding protein
VKFVSVRAWSAAAAVLLAAATAAGCSASGGSSAAGTASLPIVTGLESTNILVYDYPGLDSAGLYVAEYEGLFAKEGLHVTVVPDAVSSQDGVGQIESGKAQVDSGDWVTYMNDFAGGDPNLEIIGEASILQPGVLTLMESAGSTLKSVKQLKGATIPVSGKNDITTLLIDSLLFDNGVPINSVHYKLNVALPKVPFDIAAHQFVTGPVPQPYMSLGEEETGDSVFADMDQGAMTNFPIQGYAVTKQWAAKNPNTLKAFATALDEGQEIADTDRGTLEKALLAQKFLQLTPGIVSVINTPDFPTSVDPTQIDRVMNDMIQFGFFTDKKTLAAANAFDASKVVYTGNLANANGQSILLSGG